MLIKENVKEIELDKIRTPKTPLHALLFKIYIILGMSDDVKRGSECWGGRPIRGGMRYHGKGEGIRGRESRWGKGEWGCRPRRDGVSTHVRLYLNSLTPERDNGFLKLCFKLTIYVTLYPEQSRAGQLVYHTFNNIIKPTVFCTHKETDRRV